MSIDLPNTGHSTAIELAVWCSDVQLARAVTYLEMVRIKQITPGPEIEKLFGEDALLTWDIYELDAVQRRLALTLCIKRKLPYHITDMIRECVLQYRTEVLADFGLRRNR